MMPMPERGYRIHAAALSYFDAVRRARSIRGAARGLNVASSAVNRQVLALEAEVGEPLFERLPAGLKLTAAGEVLAQHVIGVLRDAERVQSALDALKGLHAGHVELVTLEGLCHHIVPAAIERMNARYPRVTIGVEILGSEAIPQAIMGGEAHLGLAFEAGTQPALRLVASATYALGVVALPGSPVARLASATLNDIRDLAVILPKANFANRGQLDPVMRQAGMQVRGRYEAASIGLMKELVLRGLGVALMTRVGLEAELASGRLVHVPLRHRQRVLRSELGLYGRAVTALPVAAEMFAHFVSETLLSAGNGVILADNNGRASG
jgi:DNA-binding transcriptional LysR family regulator